MAAVTSGPPTSNAPAESLASLEPAIAAQVPLPTSHTPSAALDHHVAEPLTSSRKTLSPQGSDGGRAVKSPKSLNAPLHSRIALTGAAAMTELRKRKQNQISHTSRETSPNPVAQAMQSLLGSNAMSRPSDAPDPTKLGEPPQKLPQRLSTPEGTRNEVMRNHSPGFAIAPELSGPAGTTATTHDTTLAQPQFVDEPGEMGDGDQHDPNATERNGASASEEGPKAFTYPGPPPQTVTPGPSRGMSLPGYGQSSPKSPGTGSSNKRHKCPYCATEFTRHHNLKSHLLTHSQEKPYVCSTCPARFRRLHDLKRHTKLHTGERPHTCDKCGRKFARGDALARHNKGPGGCAGRRSSFGGEDDFGPDGIGGDMDGLEYTGEDDDDDDGPSPDQGRRISEPSRKRTHIESRYDSDRQVYRQQSSTYPPVYPPPQPRSHGGGAAGGGVALPSVVLPDSNQVASPRDMNSYPSPAAAGSSLSQTYYAPPPPGSVFQQPGGITDSPKPLSPGHPPDQQRLGVGDVSMSSTMNRNRSPSLTTQFQQAHFGRGSGGRSPPVPHPVLPPLGSSNNIQPQSRSALGHSAMSASGPPSTLHQPPPPIHASNHTNNAQAGSNPTSMSSHGQRSSGGSIRDVFGISPSDHGPGGQGQIELWNYVRSLEARFGRMQDEYELRISRLQEEVISLRNQVAGFAAGGNAGAAGGGAGGGGTYSGEIPQARY